MDAKTLVESIVTGDEAAGEYFTATLSSRIAERLEVLKVAAASQMMGEDVEQIDELKSSTYYRAAELRGAQVQRATIHNPKKEAILKKKIENLKTASNRRGADEIVNARINSPDPKVRLGSTIDRLSGSIKPPAAPRGHKVFTKADGTKVINPVVRRATQLQLALEKVEQVNELTSGKGSAMRNVAAARLKQARAINRGGNSVQMYPVYQGLMQKARAAKTTDSLRQKDARINAPLAKLSDATKRKLGASKRFTPLSGYL